MSADDSILGPTENQVSKEEDRKWHDESEKAFWASNLQVSAAFGFKKGFYAAKVIDRNKNMKIANALESINSKIIRLLTDLKSHEDSGSNTQEVCTKILEFLR